jgi:transcriptional regulator with XRE-family HTH domain
MADATKELAKRFGAGLREIRHARGLTQAVLAGRVGVAPNYLALLERGERMPSFEILARLQLGLGVDVVDMFGRPEGGLEVDRIAEAVARAVAPIVQTAAVDAVVELLRTMQAEAAGERPDRVEAGDVKGALGPGKRSRTRKR